jgi:N-methylhydantoinase A
MQTVNVLGMSLGESFVEFALLSDSKVIATKRSYLPRENLKSSLQAFLEAQKQHTLSEAYISLRVPQKMFDSRLGGMVATISTEGFEHWTLLQESKLEVNAEKDLQFSIKERIGADGQVIEALRTEDLEAIAEKLTAATCKRVCLQFLHASLFPQHQNAARDFFTAKGFEVFCPTPSDNPNETSRWKTHSLNALAGSVFTEIKQEVMTILETKLTPEHIHFVNSSGRLEKSEDTKALSGQLAHLTALAAMAKDPKKDYLYLGLEGFYLIHPAERKTQWNSKWGAIELSHFDFEELDVHPTQKIDLNQFGRLDFSNEKECWEPGPMMLGRGQKPTLIDLWSENPRLTEIETFTDRLAPAGQTRFKNTLMALNKVNNSNAEVSSLMKNLQSLAVQKLVMEVILKKKNSKVQVIGPLSALFANGFKKDTQTTIDTQEHAEATALALWGLTLQGAN